MNRSRNPFGIRRPTVCCTSEALPGTFRFLLGTRKAKRYNNMLPKSSGNMFAPAAGAEGRRDGRVDTQSHIRFQEPSGILPGNPSLILPGSNTKLHASKANNNEGKTQYILKVTLQP